MSEPTDWDELVRRARRFRVGLVAAMQLERARMVLGAAVPESVPAALAGNAAWWRWWRAREARVGMARWGSRRRPTTGSSRPPPPAAWPARPSWPGPWPTTWPPTTFAVGTGTRATGRGTPALYRAEGGADARAATSAGAQTRLGNGHRGRSAGGPRRSRVRRPSVPTAVPSAGLEPALTAPEADALSAELRGRATGGGPGRLGPPVTPRRANCSATPGPDADPGHAGGGSTRTYPRTYMSTRDAPGPRQSAAPSPPSPGATGSSSTADPSSVHLERPARREPRRLVDQHRHGHRQAGGDQSPGPGHLPGGVLEADPPAHTVAIEVAGPGFVNFRLDDGWLHEALAGVVAEGEAGYARPDVGHGERVQVEFISANPTGPIHVGNGWWGSYGDALARVLDRAGYRVSREYYVNDTGGQIRTLGESLLARRHGDEVPEGGYQGEYVTELAATYDGPDDVTAAGRWAAERILERIRASLASVGIVFDEWYSQASIEESGAVDETIALLAAKGLVFEQDGATWFRATELGDMPRPGPAQVERRRHLSGRRPGLPPRQVPGAGLRPGHRRVRRRPPRPGGQPDGRGRGPRASTRRGSRSSSGRWCR